MPTGFTTRCYPRITLDEQRPEYVHIRRCPPGVLLTSEHPHRPEIDAEVDPLRHETCIGSFRTLHEIEGMLFHLERRRISHKRNFSSFVSLVIESPLFYMIVSRKSQCGEKNRGALREANLMHKTFTIRTSRHRTQKVVN